MITTLEATTSALLQLTNGATIGLAPGTNQVVTALKGWHGSAGVRRNSTPRLWAHGSFTERGWKNERVISLSGHVSCGDRGEAAALVDKYAALFGDGLPGVFVVNDADQGERRAEVVLAGAIEVDWDGGLEVDFTVDMVAPDPRKYGPLSAAVTEPSAPGGGLQFNLFSASAYTITRTNLIPNPSFELTGVPKNGTMTPLWYTRSGTSWNETLLNGTHMLRLTASGIDELQYAYVFTGIPVTPGQYVNFAMAASAGFSGQVKASLFFVDSAGASLSTPRPDTNFTTMGQSVYAPELLTTGPQLVPATAATVKIPVYALTENGGNPLTAYVYLDSLIFITGPDAASVSDTSYFDGSTTPPAGYVNAWTGEVHASTSIQSRIDSGVDGVLDFSTGGTAGSVTVANNGTADVPVAFDVTGYAPGFTITEAATGRQLVYTADVIAGDTLTLDGADGSVTLNGTADRSAYLSRRDWTNIQPGSSATFLFESTGATGALMTVRAASAWW